VPAVIDNADPIGIPVVTDAQIRLFRQNQLTQVLHVFRHGGVGQMVGKMAVRIAVERHYLMTQAAPQLRRDGAGSAVAGIDNHLELARKRKFGAHHLHILGDDALLRDMAAARSHIAVPEDDLLQLLDGLAVKRGQPLAHLEAVVLDGIMAAGDHHTAIGLVVEDGIIEDRRHHLADHVDIQTGGDNSVDEKFGKMGRSQTHIMSDGDQLVTPLAHPGAISPAEVVSYIIGQIRFDNAANVILAENPFIHDRLPGRRDGRVVPCRPDRCTAPILQSRLV